MPRYIDAYKIPYHDLSDGKGLCQVAFLEDVIKMPTADVVEVVRCNDCKYGEVDNADFPNQYLCHHHGSAWNEGNHFCSYGERSDE